MVEKTSGCMKNLPTIMKCTLKIWASEIFLDKRVNNMVYVKKTEYKGRIICGYFYKELSFYKNS